MEIEKIANWIHDRGTTLPFLEELYSLSYLELLSKIYEFYIHTYQFL